MGLKPVEDLIDASSSVHFSGFHMDGLAQSTSDVDQPTTSTGEDVHKQPFVIGVAGGAASRKTTVYDLIIEQLHYQRVVLVNEDSFYHNLTPEELARVHEYNFDHPGKLCYNMAVVLGIFETKLKAYPTGSIEVTKLCS